MSSWKHINDGLPISGPNDYAFDGLRYELKVQVMDQYGKEHDTVFQAYFADGGTRFIREFAVDFCVVYWRIAE